MNSLLVKRTHFFLEGEVAPPQRPWLPLVLSAVLHLLVIAAILFVTRKDITADSAPAAQAEPERRIDLATLPPYQPQNRRPVPPPSRPAVQPPSRPIEPPPDRMPRPQVQRGEHLDEDVTVAPEPPPEKGPLAEAPAQRAPDAASSALSAQRSALETRNLAMATEAQRLFGRPQHGVTNATGPEPNARWAQELTDDRDNDCRPSRRAPRDPGAPVEMGQVSGQVFREGTRQPLAGAFLQILGTPYSTFADDEGWYTLQFDQSLVDACRTQYVQVSKDGFRPRRLILGLGVRANNNIPMSRR
ncbi:MAG TPA: hypothetical protein VFK36_07550 [Gemmatimonadales bacterium]|nr:hypothetical protein [Gemmatimonadales bacterium]